MKSSSNRTSTQPSRAIKSLLDRCIAGLTLFLVSPLMLLVALAIYFKMGSPIIFKQPRPGLKGKIFNCYKFRTMTNARNQNGELLSDEERLTAFGQFLRKTSLDELPQLWNVLKGDMSFVGPRPLMVEYLDRYTSEQARRHDVIPGITGWAQIKGRNAISWEEKFKFDVWYVDHWSLGLDLKILLLTTIKVLKREGISSEDHVTMTDFLGEQQNFTEPSASHREELVKLNHHYISSQKLST